MNMTSDQEYMSQSTVQKIRGSPTVANHSSDKVHKGTVMRRVNDWVSEKYLTEQQI